MSWRSNARSSRSRWKRLSLSCVWRDLSWISSISWTISSSVSAGATARARGHDGRPREATSTGYLTEAPLPMARTGGNGGPREATGCESLASDVYGKPSLCPTRRRRGRRGVYRVWYKWMFIKSVLYYQKTVTITITITNHHHHPHHQEGEPKTQPCNR